MVLRKWGVGLIKEPFLSHSKKYCQGEALNLILALQMWGRVALPIRKTCRVLSHHHHCY